MTTWWLEIGQTSFIVGGVTGLVWAILSTSRRRRKFLSAAIPPVGQWKWFTLQMLSMGAYISQIVALGISAHHELLPIQLFWFLLAGSMLVFALASSLAGARVETAHYRASGDLEAPPGAQPPQLPLSRTA